MPDGGLDLQRAQGAHAAYAQDDLLRDACIEVAAIDAGREVPVVGRILLHVAVEQDERDAADLNLPQPRIEGTARQFHRNGQRFPVGIEEGDDGHIVKGVAAIVGLLPAVFGDAL